MMVVSGSLLLLTLLTPQDVEPDLPPVHKVTLQVKDVPAPEVIRLLQHKTDLPIHFIPPRSSLVGAAGEPSPRKVTLDIQEVPFFEALTKLCEAHGDLVFLPRQKGQIEFFRRYGFPVRTWPQGLFHVHLGGVYEATRHDFVEDRRFCRITLQLGWQPDVTVLAAGPLEITRVVADTGKELLGGKIVADGGKHWKPHRRGPLVRNVELPLPPEAAKSVTLTARLGLEVPRKLTPVRINLGAGFKGARFGRYKVEGDRRVDGEEINWSFRVLPDKGKLSSGQVRDPFMVSRAGYWYWSGWKFGNGEMTEKDDGSVEMSYRFRKSEARSLHFAIAEGKRRIRVPLNLEAVPLPK